MANSFSHLRVPRAARRMLALANALEGMSFTEAARVVGIERQPLSDAVKRYNAEGVAGLYDRPKPCRRRKLAAEHERELSQIILEGPDPEVDGISAYTLEGLTEILRLGGLQCFALALDLGDVIDRYQDLPPR